MPQEISNEPGMISALSVDDDGNYIAAGNKYGNIKVMHANSGNMKYSLTEDYYTPVTSLRWLNEKLYVVRSNGKI